jgi:hypothetical protein
MSCTQVYHWSVLIHHPHVAALHFVVPVKASSSVLLRACCKLGAVAGLLQARPVASQVPVQACCKPVQRMAEWQLW